MRTRAAPGCSRRARATALRVSRSAAVVTVQELTTTKLRASASNAATSSLSAALVRHPRLTNVPPLPGGGLGWGLVKRQDRHERLLGDLHIAHPLHPLLAFLLLLQQLALARDVAAVALGDHILALRRNRLPRNHL